MLAVIVYKHSSTVVFILSIYHYPFWEIVLYKNSFPNQDAFWFELLGFGVFIWFWVTWRLLGFFFSPFDSIEQQFRVSSYCDFTAFNNDHICHSVFLGSDRVIRYANSLEMPINRIFLNFKPDFLIFEFLNSKHSTVQLFIRLLFHLL